MHDRPSAPALLRILLLIALALACDRNLAPFDPDETPRSPDLSEIFPAPDAESPRAPERASGLARAPARRGVGGDPVLGRVEVAPALAGTVPEGSVLFIIARRAGSAGGPPLAVRRIQTPNFPLEFDLGADHVMIPSSTFDGELELTARLDSDGNAMTRLPGDLQGTASGRVSPGDHGVVIVLDQRV